MPSKIIKNKSRKIIAYLWLNIFSIVLLGYIIFPQTFNLTNILALIHRNYWTAIIIYSIFICCRGLLLISPLSVTVASLVFFPPLTVFLVNSLGILVSSTLIYKLSQYLGLGEYFEKKYQQRIYRAQASLNKKEIPIIIGWSFLPFFVTDLIVYASVTLKIPLWKCLLGIFIGTTMINAIFIYLLDAFFQSLV